MGQPVDDPSRARSALAKLFQADLMDLDDPVTVGIEPLERCRHIVGGPLLQLVPVEPLEHELRIECPQRRLTQARQPVHELPRFSPRNDPILVPVGELHKDLEATLPLRHE